MLYSYICEYECSHVPQTLLEITSVAIFKISLPINHSNPTQCLRDLHSPWPGNNSWPEYINLCCQYTFLHATWAYIWSERTFNRQIFAFYINDISRTDNVPFGQQQYNSPMSFPSNTVWWLYLVPNSTTRFANDIGYRIATIKYGYTRTLFLWMMTCNSLTENEEHDIPSQILKTILDCMPQIWFRPQYVWFPVH